MGSIGGPFPTSSHSVGAFGSQGTTNANEAAQMAYILGILHDITNFMNSNGSLDNLNSSISQYQEQFAADMKPPVSENTLKKMQGELNSIIERMNSHQIAVPFQNWSLKADQSHPGYSFMHAMLSLAQFLDGESGQDPKIHDWVAKLGDFIASGHWNANSVSQEVTQFLNAANSLGPNPNGDQFFNITLPTNIF